MPTTTAAAADPHAEYRRRLADWQQRESRFKKLDERISLARGVVFLVGVAVVLLVYNVPGIPQWTVQVAPVVFVVLLARHATVIDRLTRATAAVVYYETGLARLEDRWVGTGPAGERYAQPDHVYTEDLDLFGRGSLFQLLCRARTRLGEDTIAKWLCGPADETTVVQRQRAVEELRGGIDLRERIAVLDAEVHDELDQKRLCEWANEPARPISARKRWAAVVISIAAVATLCNWLFLDGPAEPLMAVLVVHVLFTFSFRRQIAHLAATADRANSGLAILVQVLRLIESEQFSTPLLGHIRSRLETDGLPPSRRIAKLHRLISALNNSLKNQFYAPVAFLLCLPIHLVHGIETWRKRFGPRIPDWLDAVGEFEALSTFASFAWEHPADPFPELSEPGPLFEAIGLGHPLLPEKDCVRNDILLNARTRLVVVSGSNMSGKSTLLRTVGTNAALALAGAPVRAASLRLSSVQVGSAMRVHDSLQDGKSLFYANLTRLKAIVALAGQKPPLLFLLDEILQGTNSHDRRIGAEAVIRKLLAKGAIGLVTTHDLELTRIVDSLDGQAVNVHFADRLVDGTMTFDYRICPGVVERSNALELMRMMGLDV